MSRIQTTSVYLRHRTQGFTLIEVLIAITLFSVALSLLLGGFRYTTRAWDSGDRVNRQTSDLQVVHRVFNNLLERAFPVAIAVGDEAEYAFDASERQIRFAAFLPPYPDQGGLYTLELRIEERDGRHQLRLKRMPYQEDAFQTRDMGNSEDMLVMETEQALSFAYFGREDADSDPGWSSSWEAIGLLPQLVKLSFGQDSVGWPAVITPIRINMDAACLFPDLGKKCRLNGG